MDSINEQTAAAGGISHSSTAASLFDLLRGHVLLEVLGELEELDERGGVEEQVARLGEHQGQLAEVAGHHLRLRLGLGARHQAVQLVDGAVALLEADHTALMQRCTVLRKN